MSDTPPTASASASGPSRAMSPSPPNVTRAQKSPKRKSWFSLARRSSKAPKSDDNTPTPPAPPSAFEQHQHLVQPSNALGPLQFAPNRIATLYVTPSERNLYLAAMAQLDAPPQALPLWTDPAPKLPAPPGPIDPVIRGFSPAPHPLTAVPLSPKLVTSPGLPGMGLQIREEFRAPTARTASTRHAMVSLVPNSFLRFTGFPPETIVAVDGALSENWPMGVWLKSEEIDVVSGRGGDGKDLTWKVELHGRAWKRKGSQELDSVRLVLALLITLGVHGWTVVESVQAAGMQATHNLVFRHSPEVQAIPPAYFALSLPLPERISVISPPNKTTPALLTAVRNAITSNSHLARSKGHSRSGTADTAVSTDTTTSNEGKRLKWGKDVQAKGVKLEGWVHPGVYRFWIAGMRRWLGGGVKASRVENLQPQLLISLIENLSALGFDLTASIPLLPVAKGRDILYFASTPASGLTYLDTFRPDATVPPSSRSDSPVFISPPESLGPAASAPNGAPALPPPLPPRKDQPAAVAHAEADADGRRVLPWTSIISDDPPVVNRRPSQIGRSQRSQQSPQPASPTIPTAPPATMPQEVMHRLRTRSQDSSVPLLPSAGHDAQQPKQRNVLLKKNSLRRRSISRGSSVDMPGVAHSMATAPALAAASAGRNGMRDTAEDDGQWSMVNIPRNGQVLPSTFEPILPRFNPHALPTSPPPTSRLPPVPTAATLGAQQTRSVQAAEYLPTRPSFESNASIYQDTHETQPSQAILPATATTAADNFHMAQIPLGQPLTQSTLAQHDPGSGHLAPLRDPASARRAGSAMVDVEGGIGIPSMHGSLGFYPGPASKSNASDGMSEVSLPPPVPPPKVGTSRTRMVIE